MLHLLKNLPENVIGISAEGEVSGEDYETILIPAITEKLKHQQQINLLYHLGDKFIGFTFSAMIDDAIVGLKNIASWKKIAFVSNHHVINGLANFFGHMLHCELKTFKNEELEAAKKWISEG